MLCKKCETDSPEGTRFCPNCGAPLVEPPAVVQKTFPWIPVLGGAAGALAIAVIIMLVLSNRNQQLTSAQIPPTPANVAQAPAVPQQPHVAQGPSVPQQPQVATAPAVQPTPPPKEVVDYLLKLKAIEEQRKRISNDTALGNAMYQAATSAYFNQNQDSSRQTVEGFNNLISRLEALRNQVRLLPTPQSCRPLANSYLNVLSSHIRLITEIKNALSTNDIAKAMSLQQTMKPLNDADTEFLKRADEELDKLCKSTGATRDFTISD